MDDLHFARQYSRPGSPTTPPSLLDWLQQPSVIICLAVIALTAFYQSLHSSPFADHRHPGELLWDCIIAITPASVLYTIDDWLHPPMFPAPKSLRPRTYVAKSELLRKVLGMDQPGGGLIGSVASAGRKSLSTLSGSTLLKRDCSQPAGLGNIDYSCFQNSILQGLTSLRPLPTYLDSAITPSPQSQQDSPEESSASSLQQLIAQLRDRENNGKTLWTPRKLKSLHTWEQQDAQEYFSKLLDEVEKEVAKASKEQYKPPGVESALTRDDTESEHSDDSGYQSLPASSKAVSEAKVARNPLEGMAAQRVACVQCGFSEGLSLIPFNCLTLHLGVGTMQHDLYELLDSYTQLESIEGVECAKCTLLKAQRLLKMLLDCAQDKPDELLQEPRARLEAVELALEEDDFEEKTLKDKCKISGQHRSSSTKTKQVAIARPPRSLAIHMNRSVFDENTGNMWKNFAAVRFPSTLDLGPWCLGSANQTALSRDRTLSIDQERKLDEDEESWVSDPKASMISGDKNPSKISGPIYELRAVVTHQGQHENGHYVCYRKHPGLSPDEKEVTTNNDNENQSTDEEKTLAETTTDDENVEQWWRLSDESVWNVTEENVLAQGGVFMLFYDCVDPHSVLASEQTRQGSPVIGKDENDFGIGEVSHAPVPSAEQPQEPGLPRKDEDHHMGAREVGDVPMQQPVSHGLATQIKPTTVATDDQQRDAFVSSLLTRPNSSNAPLSLVAKEGPPVPSSAPVLTPAAAASDSFVSSLLGRPNA
ncbi:hypothetical protein JX265_008580 [Neoarthrinium moseri]|uniref:ubiquitinyl hydrolase 1 n=1 Tax=Neoarthrinium moseri TaxID=1658444 RepID=A0A9P9WHT7_9PEZI|nr:hypothetical protein JX265_008580 [Neoarthrinium moseri]